MVSLVSERSAGGPEAVAGIDPAGGGDPSGRTVKTPLGGGRKALEPHWTLPLVPRQVWPTPRQSAGKHSVNWRVATSRQPVMSTPAIVTAQGVGGVAAAVLSSADWPDAQASRNASDTATMNVRVRISSLVVRGMVDSADLSRRQYSR